MTLVQKTTRKIPDISGKSHTFFESCVHSKNVFVKFPSDMRKVMPSIVEPSPKYEEMRQYFAT